MKKKLISSKKNTLKQKKYLALFLKFPFLGKNNYKISFFG
jgi:hypothetical protein